MRVWLKVIVNPAMVGITWVHIIEVLGLRPLALT